MSNDIAIIGAGGFVGSRLVETLVLSGQRNVRAIVRAFRSFAPLSRFGDRIALLRADAEDLESIRSAVSGCATVINLTTGTPAGILRTTQAIYHACVLARASRLIHLSSAVVYGEVASPTTTDDSPPVRDHWMPYARAKIFAESWLRRQAASSACQVVVLRPGIVWGTRSAHTADIARALASRSAYLVDDGNGIFNGIHIDNLIACLRRCQEERGDPSGFYNVSDCELITWQTFYGALGAYLGCDVQAIPRVPGNRFPWSPRAAFEYVQDLPLINGFYHRLKRRLPDPVRARIKRWLASRPPQEPAASPIRSPSVSRELWHLQKTKYKLSPAKFTRRFGFVPPVSFQEGIDRTIQWLKFLGYAS